MLPTAPSCLPSPSLPPCEPFLKWAGGKSQILPLLEPYFPCHIRGYHEPFVGSGAVFFYLRRTRGFFPARLSDYNAELINCYKVVRNDVERLIRLLQDHRANHSVSYYYYLRDTRPDKLDKTARAARLIYLNKTCYNGLYRVNKKGQFNVPIGSYKNPRILNAANLRAVSEVLVNSQLEFGDFSTVLDYARPGELIYFDPPYYTENGFTGYARQRNGKTIFGADEHRKLSEIVEELHERGCHVIVSNSDTKYIHYLYRKFRKKRIVARRLINCDGSGRGFVTELIICNIK